MKLAWQKKREHLANFLDNFEGMLQTSPFNLQVWPLPPRLVLCHAFAQFCNLIDLLACDVCSLSVVLF